ncbi:thioredoxin family protein [Chryseobacterium sp. A301]
MSDSTGIQSQDLLKRPAIASWFQPQYDEYPLDLSILDELRILDLKSIQKVLFFGTWCEDSQEQVPRLMKIFERLELPTSSLTLYTVDEEKKEPKKEIQNFQIEKVPTLLLLKNGEELGRIVERPQSESLEKDLLRILQTVQP